MLIITEAPAVGTGIAPGLLSIGKNNTLQTLFNSRHALMPNGQQLQNQNTLCT